MCQDFVHCMLTPKPSDVACLLELGGDWSGTWQCGISRRLLSVTYSMEKHERAELAKHRRKFITCYSVSDSRRHTLHMLFIEHN